MTHHWPQAEAPREKQACSETDHSAPSPTRASSPARGAEARRASRSIARELNPRDVSTESPARSDQRTAVFPRASHTTHIPQRRCRTSYRLHHSNALDPCTPAFQQELRSQSNELSLCPTRAQFQNPS